MSDFLHAALSLWPYAVAIIAVAVGVWLLGKDHQ